MNEVTRVLDLHMKKNPKVSKDDFKQLKSSLTDAKSSAVKHDNNADKVLAVIDNISPMSDDEAREYRTQLPVIGSHQ